MISFELICRIFGMITGLFVFLMCVASSHHAWREFSSREFLDGAITTFISITCFCISFIILSMAFGSG